MKYEDFLKSVKNSSNTKNLAPIKVPGFKVFVSIHSVLLCLEIEVTQF